MSTTASLPSEPEPGFEELAQAVDDAAKAVAALDDPAARQAAEALRDAVEAAHRQALVTVVRRLREDPQTREVLFELVDDPLVHLLLSLHGIVRPDPMTAGTQALQRIRPQLQSHGGDAELVRVEAGPGGGTAWVRYEGACTGGSMEALTLREGVERALLAVPQLARVAEEPTRPGPTLIPLAMPRRRDVTHEPGWVKTSALADVPDGKVTPMRLVTASDGEQDVVVVRLGDRMTAYKDACAHQGLPLADGLLDATAGTLTCRWHGFCYDALSGECMSASGATLEQLPLRVDDGHVWVKAGS
jgi:nitrite reductase/ring-hydroxylating ferredoxin subunit/Fe-S cluster biogenesis protein NfuA